MLRHDYNPISWFSIGSFPFLSYHRFVGERNREEATRMMESLSDGTFLIRVSNQGSRRGEYALSVRSVEYTEKDARA